MRPIYDIIIIGCGLGGLAAAIAIRKAGHRVTVYERAPNLAEASVIYFVHSILLLNVSCRLAQGYSSLRIALASWRNGICYL